MLVKYYVFFIFLVKKLLVGGFLVPLKIICRNFWIHKIIGQKCIDEPFLGFLKIWVEVDKL